MLRLAWPVLVEQLLVMMVGLVDLWLTGNYLQRPHLAAIGLMSYVLWLIPSIFGIVAIGATALTARFVGCAGLWMRRIASPIRRSWPALCWRCWSPPAWPASRPSSSR